MTGIQVPKTAVVTGGRRDKDDRNQNTLGPLGDKIKHEGGGRSGEEVWLNIKLSTKYRFLTLATQMETSSCE